ncbi:Cold shock domain-containing protein E1 [Bagarius yarrelli]|uniref:Cold shock domain-containing protein E1 n=1 Tax=Bagarius yarrelli TaxID=175774 RepID=A0A556TR69_BAGYA|nr:Cold shock domain-containing protein E1 [Bagarius yarrelli]
MSKGRKRSKAQKAANADKFAMPPRMRPPPPVGFCGGRPQRPPFGPPMSADQFRMRPPNFGPPMIEHGPFIMREQHGPGFHPQEFGMPPRFHRPHLEDGPRGFYPDLYEDRPAFHPVETEGGPLGFVSPKFMDRPVGFVPPGFRDITPGFIPPDHRDGPPRCVPPALRDGPPRCVPLAPRDGPPRCVPLALRDGPRSVPVAGIRPTKFVHEPGSTMNLDRGSLDVHSNTAPSTPCPSHGTPNPMPETSGPDNNENSKHSSTMSTETSNLKKEDSLVKHTLGSFKPPPGRSLGVITFISSSYGFIEREDLKKFSFSFDAFLGKRTYLVPGVKVHFTAVKERKKEFATDVKVAPGGTEEITPKVYEGVVTAVLPDTYVLEAYPGRIRTILGKETVKLPYGKTDSKASLLLFDRVKFQLCTNIINKVRRATNITPQMPETFQLTKETRETGVIMGIKDKTCTILSKIHENLTAPLTECLSDEQLKVMDEVEFTVVTWKPVISKEEGVYEDISSEKYEGTISKIISKTSQNEMGSVDTTVANTQKSLPFGAGDVITKATMLVGDKVQFNIATNQQNKVERAVNIEFQAETFLLESIEQRKIGTIIKLDANSGLIKTQHDPQLVFDLSEVMHDAKLSLSEKVEFTLVVGVGADAEGKQAIRVRKLTECVFTSVPKIEEKKEKKKMTIKLMKDPKESAEKTESENIEAAKAPKQDSKDKQENLFSRSRERSRRRSRSRSRERSSSYHSKHRSSSRDRSYQSRRRSRSRSKDHSRTYRCKYSRSRSRSRERSNRSGKKKSNSPDRKPPINKECRNPDDENKTSHYAAFDYITSPSTHTVNNELEKKRKELLALNELIARKKAIIAMEQNTKMTSQLEDVLEMDGQQGIATFDYQHKPCLENAWATKMKPVRSILKKHSESLTGPQLQKTEKSDSIEEPKGSPEASISSIYKTAGAVPVWVKQSSIPESENQELTRKRRQLEELSESLARKRAITAMEQKAKALCDGSEIKKEYNFAPCSDDMDIIMTNRNIWQLDIKPDLQPKKSILKKRSECVTDQPQMDFHSAGQYAPFSVCKQPNDLSACLDPCEPSDASFKKPCNSPSVISNSVKLFTKLLNQSTSPCTSKQSFQPSSGSYYDQENTREIKDQSYSTSFFPISQFSHKDGEAASTSEGSATSEQKSNISTQMQRFLGALNKADSNLVSSLDRYSNKPFYDYPKYVEDRKRYHRQTSDRRRIESSLSSVQQTSEDANEHVEQKTSQYQAIQDLLQTIGLNLDTTEVRKLADRTNERLYGKKAKVRRAPSQNDERSMGRYDRRGSSHSTDSEGVRSVSPVKTSKREVYMSYVDSMEYLHDEASGAEREMFTLKRTIRNSPEAKQKTPESFNIALTEATHNTYNPAAETFLVPQAVLLPYNQISSEYAVGREQNPYVNPLHYSTSYSLPPPPFPPGYGSNAASASMVPPSPTPFYPPMSPLTTSGNFGPPPSPYPSTSGQFDPAMHLVSSGYATQKAKTKTPALSRCLKTIQTVPTPNSVSVSAAQEMCTVISIETRDQPKIAVNEAEFPVSSVTEDDIKAKQKKRLEQFNQRMRLKKEQQIEAQRTRGPSQKSAPGKVIQTEVKNVWICGHSLVFWAEKRATSPEIGMQLGMDPNSVHIWWKGVQGMTWQQLLPQLFQLKDNWPKPDMIIIHLGGNDLGKLTPENFVLAVKKDMKSLKSIFPQCHLVWSDILPRKSWRHSDDSTTVNNMRHAVNQTIHGVMAEIGSSSLTHDNINPVVDSGLYRPDGVHLSGKGIDTFNLNMQDFLEKWECEISETETSES